MQTHSDSYAFGGANARVDPALAELVERGVEFHKTLGRTVAIAYFKENHVPDDVIHRILSPSRERRARPAQEAGRLAEKDAPPAQAAAHFWQH